jgi:hypothetical protein
MSSRDIASTAFKLAGIYVFVQTIQPLSELLTFLAYDRATWMADINVPLMVIGRLFPLVIAILLGSVLIVNSHALADRAVRDPGFAGGSGRTLKLHAVLLSTAGVLLMGMALPRVPMIFQNLAILFSDQEVYGVGESRAQIIRATWSWGTGVTLQFLCGAVLFLWNKRIVKLLNRGKVRTANRGEERTCPHCGHAFRIDDYRPDAESRLCSKCQQELPAGLFGRSDVGETRDPE